MRNLKTIAVGIICLIIFGGPAPPILAYMMRKNYLKIAIFLAIFLWVFGGRPQAQAATETLRPDGEGDEPINHFDYYLLTL